MAITIPATADQAASNKSALESRLNQNTPPAPLAYNNVVAGLLAMIFTTLYKYGADRYSANLWISAQGADLDYLGSEYNLPRITAIPAKITATLPATDGTVIPLGIIFNSSATGLQYQTTASATAPYPGGTGTGVTLTLVCLTAGSSSNAGVGSTLSIQSPIAGAGTIATVASTVTAGTDPETDDAYRVRGLALVQTLPTGSNASSYRIWAQSVPGVANVYPYAGAPTPSTSYPGMRTVYVECTPAIQADGIAPGWLLTNVRAAITTNPNTGLANQDLGLTDGDLFILAIRRTSVTVNVNGLTVPSGLISACKADISTALTNYFLTVKPFCQGIDPGFSRNDTVSVPILSQVIQTVLTKYGAFIQAVTLQVAGGGLTTSYTVRMGEKTKLSSVIWT